MVRINKVYTKTGDKGRTHLIGGDKVPKSDPRIECYGTVDELNACVGLIVSALEGSKAEEELAPILLRVQNELFNLGAQLATPDAERRAKMPPLAPRHVEALEADIDRCNESLPDLTSFVLPGGSWVSSYCHLARTVCRRAERLVVALANQAEVEAEHLIYLNRLSDALFVFGRYALTLEGRSEALWTPEDT